MKKFTALLLSSFAAGLTVLVGLYYTGEASIFSRDNAHSPESRQSRQSADSRGRTGQAQSDALGRGRWEMMRHGFNLGVPRDAYANAMAQRRRMEAASMAEIAGRPAAVFPNWTFIGPRPMAGQKANFGGAQFGNTFNATGRISAIAIDPAGNVYVGAAGGGVWLSKNHGSTFSWISKALPTQSIGSIAIDSNTSPPTVYVGTGEGNSAVDTYYGLGMFSTQDFGNTWTAVDPSKFSANGAYQAFTSLSIPCQHFFAGTGNGVSSSRGVSNINECEPGTFSTGFNCMQGAIYESIQPSPGTTWHRIFGRPLSQDPNGGPVRSLAIGAIVDTQTFAEIPAMFGTIDGLGLVSTEDSTGIPFTCGSTTLSPFDVAGAGNSVLVQPVAGTVGRSSVATGNPNKDLQVYAIIGDPDLQHYAGFFNSSVGGESWTPVTTPCAATSNQGASWSTNPAQCAASPLTLDGTAVQAGFSQAFYDQALMTWPGDTLSNTVYFGGVGIYRSSDAGTTWDFIAKNGGTHSDQHAIAFDPTNNTQMYVGNDGGLYRFDTAANTWTELNDDINAGQIQAVGPHPTDNNKMLVGFQDNGTQLFSGALSWSFSQTGDGGFVQFDHSDPTHAYHEFASSPGPNGQSLPNFESSTGGGLVNTWVYQANIRAVMSSVILNPTQGLHDEASFYSPFAADPVVAHRVVTGGHAIYVSTDGMAHFAQMSNQLVGPSCLGGCTLTDIEFAPGDHRVIYTLASQAVASDGTTTFPFKVFVTTNGNLNTGVTFTDVTGNLPFATGKTQATTIAISPFDPRTAYLGISGYNSNTMIVRRPTSVTFSKPPTWGRTGPRPTSVFPIFRSSG
jgi:hypothetical protein